MKPNANSYASSYERRQLRSENPGPALTLWLQGVARREGLDELVLADAEGFLVASAGNHPKAETLAAVAPLPDASAHFQREFPHLVLQVRTIEVAGDSFFICALNRRSDGVMLEDVEGGILRILGATGS